MLDGIITTNQLSPARGHLTKTQTLLQTMTAKEYASAVMETALKNGLTLDQVIKANLYDLAKAHHEAQLKAIDKAGEEIKKQYPKSGI